jgi:hypothetical protein
VVSGWYNLCYTIPYRGSDAANSNMLWKVNGEILHEENNEAQNHILVILEEEKE